MWCHLASLQDDTSFNNYDIDAMHLATPDEIEKFLNSPSGQVNVVTRMQRIAIPKLTPLQKEDLLQRQREHWRSLHTRRMQPEEFDKWVDSIPGCSTCQRDFRKLLETTPPRFDDWQKWTWEIHNAVNEKLGRPLVTWREACELWGWYHPTSPR